MFEALMDRNFLGLHLNYRQIVPCFAFNYNDVRQKERYFMPPWEPTPLPEEFIIARNKEIISKYVVDAQIGYYIDSEPCVQECPGYSTKCKWGKGWSIEKFHHKAPNSAMPLLRHGHQCLEQYAAWAKGSRCQNNVSFFTEVYKYKAEFIIQNEMSMMAIGPILYQEGSNDK
uniref:Uncharacterized protein n=1 Tax=Romanomermis culicivorax TaxID=13658 RepID=A0A915I535_ROMCU